jgi:heparan-alpha-glucosaminide N-acetyltransferase
MSTTVATVDLPLVVEQPPARLTAPPRNIAVDAYRGFVMLLMMAEVLRFSLVAQSFPGNWFWQLLSFNQSHTEWVGCSLHDTIQPGFSFLVGVALPYSIASRVAKGKTFENQLLHAIWRSFLLIILGIFLRSIDHPQTYFTFEDTLSQIGLGYTFLFLLGYAKEKWLWISLSAILFGYWLAWALYPVAGPGFNWQAVGVPADWSTTSPASWRTGTRTQISATGSTNGS